MPVDMSMSSQWGVQWWLLLKCHGVADCVEGKTPISVPYPFPLFTDEGQDVEGTASWP